MTFFILQGTDVKENKPQEFYFHFAFHSFSSKLRREELEHLRRELEQLKARLSESHIMPTYWFSGTAHVLSPVLVCKANASAVLQTTCSSSLSLNRKTGGGCVPPAGRGQRDQETVRTQLQGKHNVSHRLCLLVDVCFVFFQILNLSYCVLCSDVGRADRQLQSSQQWSGEDCLSVFTNTARGSPDQVHVWACAYIFVYGMIYHTVCYN